MVVDDILLHSNIHTCKEATTKFKSNKTQTDLTDPIAKASRKTTTGCLNAEGICAAHFPRDIYPETRVDGNGHIFMKKLEPMINTITPALTYLMRSNTDVTSLLSGTSIKAIISYVTDYVTKPTLKTHQISSAAYDIYNKNSELLEQDVKSTGESARKLLVKIVNALSSKMEIGSPLASLYLLGNPDHYTSHDFGGKVMYQMFRNIGMPLKI